MRGENLTAAHQRSAGIRPRPGKSRPSPAAVVAAKRPDESMDEASLRLQIARADTEELDRQKRQHDLDLARGAVVTKEQAVDLAQAAVLRVVQILDLLPEKVRDLGHPPTPEDLEAIIRAARQEISGG
jgi:hypothetical protein